jgi:hypothetical protein
MRDGKETPKSLKLLGMKCEFSGKDVISEIQVNRDILVRLRGKKRINSCVILKSVLEEAIGELPKNLFIATSREDFADSLVSFVLPVEKLSMTQKSILQRKFSGENKKVFY